MPKLKIKLKNKTDIKTICNDIQSTIIESIENLEKITKYEIDLIMYDLDKGKQHNIKIPIELDINISIKMNNA